MDEECDYSSSIGQIIKKINDICKKPKIDEQLGSALETFTERISQQEKFMENGIFRINFAEAALFLQSCANLYGKKVDLLWDQLLEFHTRLIEYDCAHEKEKGKKLNDDVITQLEERRNRYKRKKKFKLVLAQDDNLEEFLFDKPKASNKNVEDKQNVFEPDDNLTKAWKNLELESTKITKIPNAVYKQQLTTYRMKNYYTMKSQDFDIFDEEDGEFNTKYSRIPGWHHIQHLFEYNTKGLLPDKNNLIATLRLGAYLKVKFLRNKKIPFGAPYSEYKEDYLSYREKFFEAEAKKWQNMPLDSLEDLHKQLEYLSQKEQEVVNDDQIVSDPSPTSSEVTDCSANRKETDCTPLEKMIDECDDDSLFELSVGCPADLTNSDLFVRLEKLSKDIIGTKLRQDSGFFESESDGEKDNESTLEASEESIQNLEGEINVSSCENRLEISGLNLESEENNSEENTEPADVLDSNQNNDCPVDENTMKEPETNNLLPQTSACDPVSNNRLGDVAAVLDSEQDKENINPRIPNIFEDVEDTENPDNSDDFDTRSVISDHSYCRTSPPRKVLEENNNIIHENLNVSNKMKNSKATAKNQIMEPFVCGNTRIIPRIVKIQLPKEKKVKNGIPNCPFVFGSLSQQKRRSIEPKQNLESHSEEIKNNYLMKSRQIKAPPADLLPPKRRKLSSKQVEKLLNNLVVAPAVKEMKFEKFFSQNYQPQLGEGEIEHVDYESEASDDEENVVAPPIEDVAVPPPPLGDSALPPPLEDSEVAPPTSDNPVPEETPSNHDRDDVQSIFSDHSYCQRSDRDLHDDSGYVSVSQSQPSTVGEPREPIENIFEGVASPLECAGDMPPVVAEQASATQGPLPAKTAGQRKDIEPSLEGEYRRLLESLKESRKEEGSDVVQDVSADAQRDQSQEQERRETRARVTEWRDTITPILRNLKEQDFNIHEYGSRIMDGLAVDETKPFASIVEGQSSAEVVRYFIASLQLANTYNIEICGAKKGELSNDSYGVKLLKKERYHERLTDYQAPSEETLRERLKRVRAADAEHEESSEPPYKHQRMKEPLTAKRKRQSRTYPQSKVRKSSLSNEDEPSTFEHSCEPRYTDESTICQRDVRIRVVDIMKLPVASKSILKSSREDFSRNSSGIGSSVTSPASRHVHFSQTLGSCQGSPLDGSTCASTPRRMSTEDSFRYHLDSLREQNPDRRLISTPLEERRSRCMEPSSKGQTLLFE